MIFSLCHPPAGVFLLDLWFLLQTDLPICRPRLPLLKPGGEPIELWLAKIGLEHFGLVSSQHDFKNIY